MNPKFKSMLKNKFIFDEIENCPEKMNVVRLDLSEPVPQHCHSKAHIFVVLEGVASLDVENSQYVIPYGYFVWVPSEVRHRVSFSGHSVSLLKIYFPNNVRTAEVFSQIGVYPMPPLLYGIIDLFKECSITVGRDDWRYELLEATVHTLPHIMADFRFSLRLPTTENCTARRIIENIHRDYYKPLTLQFISRSLGLSERSINRYMQAELGMSFTQYLRTYRVMKAIRRMAASDESLSNIAYEVGYDSLTAFSNTFYKITGMRPSQFFRQADTEWMQ